MKKKDNKNFVVIIFLIIIFIICLIGISLVIILKNLERTKFKYKAIYIMDLVKKDRESKMLSKDADDELYFYDINASENKIVYQNQVININYNNKITGVGNVIVNQNDEFAMRFSNGKFCAYKDYADETIKIKDGYCDTDKSVVCNDLDIKVNQNDEWTQYKTVSINYKSNSCKNIEYKINDEKYEEFTKDLKIDVNNTVVYIKSLSNLNIEKVEEMLLSKIDRTPPENVILRTIENSEGINAMVVSATDPESGIKAYSFSIDGGETWTEYSSKPTYIFKNNEPGVYQIQAKVYNGTYKSVGATEELGETKSNIVKSVVHDCPLPKITVSPNGNTESPVKIISIDYGEKTECKGSYSLDGGKTWNDELSEPIYADSVDIILKNNKKEDSNENTVTYCIDNINKEANTNILVSDDLKDKNNIVVVANGLDLNNFLENSADDSLKKVIDLLKYESNLINNVEKGETSNDCSKPEISVNPNENIWTSSKIVTIEYDNNDNCPIKKYSIDGGKTWINSDKNIVTETLDANTNVLAFSGKTNIEGNISTYEITKIDSKVPIVDFKVVRNGNVLKSEEVTNNSFELDLKCDTGESDFDKYLIQIINNDKIIGQEEIKNNIFEFNPQNYNIDNNTAVNIVVTCTSLAGLESQRKNLTFDYVPTSIADKNINKIVTVTPTTIPRTTILPTSTTIKPTTRITITSTPTTTTTKKTTTTTRTTKKTTTTTTTQITTKSQVSCGSYSCINGVYRAYCSDGTYSYGGSCSNIIWGNYYTSSITRPTYQIPTTTISSPTVPPTTVPPAIVTTAAITKNNYASCMSGCSSSCASIGSLGGSSAVPQCIVSCQSNC